MSRDFRKEVFSLCKKLQKNSESQKIGQLMYEMSLSKTDKSGKPVSAARNDFAQVARNSNSEFHGFLFLDDNIGTIKLPPFFKPEHLLTEERALIERGHKTLTRFVELCLTEISAESSDIAEVMNPYCVYKGVNISTEIVPLLSDDEMMNAVTAFRRGRAYQTLVNANFTKLFGKIETNAMRTLCGIVEREINNSLCGEVSNDINDFSMKLHSKLDNITDIMFAFSVLMTSIRMSLKLTCHMLFRAICGVELFVLNDDNIINIEQRNSTVLTDFYKVFSQDISLDFTGSDMSSILLMDCELPYGGHIHEFGMLIAQTIQFAGEFGESAKYSFVTVDEDMIPAHHLVKALLSIELPVVR